MSVAGVGYELRWGVGVNVLVFRDKRRSRDMHRQNAQGITGVYTSRNTDNGVFVIRAEPSQKNICLTRNFPAGIYMEITPACITLASLCD